MATYINQLWKQINFLYDSLWVKVHSFLMEEPPFFRQSRLSFELPDIDLREAEDKRAQVLR